MRSLLDTDEEEESKAAEITLSTASLLGIFFGLVLICGVFFGFGYSMGRGNEQAAQARGMGTGPAGNAPEADETATGQSPPPAALPPAQPQDEVQAPAKTLTIKKSKPEVAEDAPAEEDAAEKAPKRMTQALAAATAAKPAATVKSTVDVASTSAPAAATLPGTIPGPGRPMVQIAAVARREDAEVLVTALRERGYGVVVRNEPQDKLLHVQVGPFADRVQATAIKQKLLSDGYNAIIKQ
jgi:DedD protein